MNCLKNIETVSRFNCSILRGDRLWSTAGVLKCLKIDLINDTDRLPGAQLLIANLLIEYIGYGKALVRIDFKKG